MLDACAVFCLFVIIIIIISSHSLSFLYIFLYMFFIFLESAYSLSFSSVLSHYFTHHRFSLYIFLSYGFFVPAAASFLLFLSWTLFYSVYLYFHSRSSQCSSAHSTYTRKYRVQPRKHIITPAGFS